MSETILIFAIVLTFSALILTVVWLLKASGLFTSIRIKVTKPSFDDLTILYKFQQGDYSQSADIFRDILNYSPSHRTLGIYYDKPADTPVDKRRYIAGVIVDETEDAEMIEQMKKDDYEIFKLPKSVNSVCTTFPFSSVFSLSIATWRVPSRLGEFLEKNKLTAYPMVEIYEPSEIHYFMPLSNHDAYFVPQALSVQLENNREKQD